MVRIQRTHVFSVKAFPELSRGSLGGGNKAGRITDIFSCLLVRVGRAPPLTPGNTDRLGALPVAFAVFSPQGF